MSRKTRILSVIAGAAVIVAAGAGSAFAAAGAGAYSDSLTGFEPYLDWSAVAGNHPAGESPHGNYSTSSTKCAVCHAVHWADPDGQALLMTDRANSCSYCHIETSVSSLTVYDGDVDNYLDDNPHAHNWYPDTGLGQGVQCKDCHQVHAAENDMTANDELSKKLLRGAKEDYSWDPFLGWVYNYDPTLGAPLDTDSKDMALTRWCAGCHYKVAGEMTFDDPSYSGRDWDGNPMYDGKSHIMTPDFDDYRGQGRSVAYSGSEFCHSCHSAEYGAVDNSQWPHFTPGAQRFLVSDTGDGAADSREDGVCLRCHVSGDGTTGVGKTF